MQLSRKDIEILNNYFATAPVLKAYLFGSYARQDANINSDIDIMVELDYQKGIGFRFIEMQNQLNQLLDKKIDLVSANGLSPYISSIIEQEKKILYER